MGHIALYRKWRPQVWEDLVGQEHISRTLINAITTNRITHAYLFCGTRGTGKTSTARILAKSLNCEAKINGSPCNKCPSCIELNNGSALDVIEIDAASNRGINEIRSLIEQVRFASVTGKYKVYIIDEFHMLTTEAFNAILKTLEEPPPKVVFVLATTEAHKVLPTIISRCQRFDFQRITVSVLVKRLRYISDQEGIIISDDSLLSISRKANGGLRDALSLLDQISSFSTEQGEIPTELVFQVLGMVSTDFLTRLAEAIAGSEPIKIIEILTELLKAGNDPVVIMTETITFFRHLLIVKSAPETAEYLEVPVSNMDALKKICTLFSVADILNCLEFLNEAIERVKKTQMAQLWLEVNFVQLCKKSKAKENLVAQADINNLLNRITELEKRIESMISGNFTVSQNSTAINYPVKNEVITNINDYVSPKGGHENISNSEKLQQSSDQQKYPNNMNFNNIWERILHETKKKSIPAAAILERGTLADIDANKNIVTVRFENEGFIELLKKKIEGVDYALGIVFSSPYKLVMEKGSLVKEEKKNNKLENASNISQILQNSVSNIPQSYPQAEKTIKTDFETVQTNKNTVEVDNQDDTTYKIQVDNVVTTVTDIDNNNDKNLQENSISENFYVRIDPIQQQYVNNDEQSKSFAINEIQVKELVESYSDDINNEKEAEHNNLIATDVNDSQRNPDSEYRIKSRKSEKDIYFAEVADVFKGKIINKVKQ